MSRKYDSIKGSALKDVSEFMCIAARTAPKAKGQDNLVIITLDKKDTKSVISRMKKIGKNENRPGCLRDAENIKHADVIVVIGTQKAPLGLNCGFCGYPTCKALTKAGGVCSYNALDLGIALGSAASVASHFHADNRLMYSIGKAAIEEGLMDKCVMAIGIPLSASGKNPFFDRN
ncbi:MAG: DUF2148 domain-containing protein [Candidatus Tantalella remota]|nr:DUF2148 domain-containing protein [Candidatus Tantalella remota]